MGPQSDRETADVDDTESTCLLSRSIAFTVPARSSALGLLTVTSTHAMG